jgi:UDPglucose 6-dehydrogenase
MNIGIVGFGFVGHALERCLLQGGHKLSVYDKFRPPIDTEGCRLEINDCDLAFVCVPTPETPLTLECDVSQVEDCVSWISVPICIKSTVVPGTVERLVSKYQKTIGFSPEFIGEHLDHPWREIDSPGFVITGGSPEIQDLVISAFSGCVSSTVEFHRTDARTAELCKYMENCFLAAKVAFVNQFHEIAAAFGVDFDELRRLWLLDSRIGSSHTQVSLERGFGGRCLPKDLHAIIAAMNHKGGVPLLEAISRYNDQLRVSNASTATPA